MKKLLCLLLCSTAFAYSGEKLSMDFLEGVERYKERHTEDVLYCEYADEWGSTLSIRSVLANDTSLEQFEAFKAKIDSGDIWLCDEKQVAWAGNHEIGRLIVTDRATHFMEATDDFWLPAIEAAQAVDYFDVHLYSGPRLKPDESFSFVEKEEERGSLVVTWADHDREIDLMIGDGFYEEGMAKGAEGLEEVWEDCEEDGVDVLFLEETEKGKFFKLSHPDGTLIFVRAVFLADSGHMAYAQGSDDEAVLLETLRNLQLVGENL